MDGFYQLFRSESPYSGTQSAGTPEDPYGVLVF